MWRERGRVQNAGRNKDDCFIGQFVFMCMAFLSLNNRKRVLYTEGGERKPIPLCFFIYFFEEKRR